MTLILAKPKEVKTVRLAAHPARAKLQAQSSKLKTSSRSQAPKARRHTLAVAHTLGPMWLEATRRIGAWVLGLEVSLEL